MLLVIGSSHTTEEAAGREGRSKCYSEDRLRSPPMETRKVARRECRAGRHQDGVWDMA